MYIHFFLSIFLLFSASEPFAKNFCVEPLLCHEKIQALFMEDMQKIQPEDQNWLISHTISAHQFSSYISSQNLSSIISRLYKISSHLKKSKTVGATTTHSGKNLFSIPYDTTRALRNIPNFYISASDLYLPNQYYIVGEEPRSHTLKIFWEAVLKAHIKTIVATSTPENIAYYNDQNYPLMVGEFSVIKLSEEVIGSSPFEQTQRIIKRVFWAVSSKEKQTITHLQLTNWPDHGAAEPNIFHQFISTVQNTHRESLNPIFVHCAAGIGRSGTFILAHHTCKKIDETPKDDLKINLPLDIIQMRMQRKGMLSNKQQLRAVVEVVKEKIYSKAGATPPRG